jgi:hypothetical protein
MTPLTVKELAYELGVSDHYVYQMHAQGFPMPRRTFPESGVSFLTATVNDAKEWIEENEFRFIHGEPILTKGQLRFGLQAGFLSLNTRGVTTTPQSQTA